MEFRYEDLFVKGNEFLDRLASFAGLPPFPERLEDLSSLVPLKSMASSNSTTARHDPRKETRQGFFRRGDPDAWREELSPQDRADIEGVCRRHMAAYGYKPTDS